MPSRNGFDESFRYLRNALEILGKCKVVHDVYDDIKPVREAFGTAWLAIDMAIRAALLEKGLSEKRIPQSWEDLRAAVAKYMAYRNGTLIKLLNAAYHGVHLAGYYHGELEYAPSAKEAMTLARRVIETLSGRKIG